MKSNRHIKHALMICTLCLENFIEHYWMGDAKNRSVFSLHYHIRSVFSLITISAPHIVHVSTHYQFNISSCQMILSVGLHKCPGTDLRPATIMTCFCHWLMSHFNPSQERKSQGWKAVILCCPYFRKNTQLTTDQPSQNVLMCRCLRISAGGGGINNKPSPIRHSGPSTLRNETTSITSCRDSIPLNPPAQFKWN